LALGHDALNWLPLGDSDISISLLGDGFAAAPPAWPVFVAPPEVEFLLFTTNHDIRAGAVREARLSIEWNDK